MVQSGDNGSQQCQKEKQQKAGFSLFACLSSKQPKKQQLNQSQDKEMEQKYELSLQMKEITSIRVKTCYSDTLRINGKQLLIGTKRGLNIYDVKSNSELNQVHFYMLSGLQILQIVPIRDNLDQDQYPNQFYVGCRNSTSFQIHRVDINTEQSTLIYQFNCLIDILLERLIYINSLTFQGLLLQDTKRLVLLTLQGQIVQIELRLDLDSLDFKQNKESQKLLQNSIFNDQQENCKLKEMQINVNNNYQFLEIADNQI
eukprot:403357185